MFRKETSTPVQEPLQVPSSPVARYQALRDVDNGDPNNELDLSEDSVDFHSLLSHGSGDSPEETAVQDSNSNTAQKNLNISSVITRIRDEGPAASRVSEKPLPGEKPEARQHSEQNTDSRKVDSGSPARESGKVRSPTVEEFAQLAKAAAEELLANHFETVKREKPHRAGWFFPLLFLCLLAGVGYALYKTSSELALAKSGIAQLSTRLSKAEETIIGLHRQGLANASRIQALYTPEKLQEEMAAYQQQMQKEMDLRLDLMALSMVQFSPVSMRGEGNDSPGNLNTVPEKSKEPQRISRAPSVNEMLREGKADVTHGGDWDVYLASYGTESQARKALEKYIRQVPAATIQAARVRGKRVFRITVPGFAGKKEASRYLDEIRAELGLEGSWIGRHVTTS